MSGSGPHRWVEHRETVRFADQDVSVSHIVAVDPNRRQIEAPPAVDHDMPEAFSGQDYFPDALGRQTFYDPPDRGFEREIRKRLDYWAKLRKDRGGG